MPPPSAATSVVAVIGDPVAHSLSPAIHNAAFAARHLDWVCVGFRVGDGQLAGAVAGIRALGLRGVSVTMPHKTAILEHLDDTTAAAADLRAVNCVINRDGTLVGDNTDGDGFLLGLAEDFGVSPRGLRCVVVGAGGAARAVIRSLAGAGAASVGVLNRSADRAQRAAELAGEVGFVATPDDVDTATLVVNATPVGMGDDGAVPLDPDLLGPHHLVAELVYHPPTTPLMVAARARGCATANGTSMLVGQAAEAFRRWTGDPAPLSEMRAAVEQGAVGVDPVRRVEN